MRFAPIALLLCMTVGGCAWRAATDPCAEALAGYELEGAYQVEDVGPLPDSSRTDGLVFGWVAEGIGAGAGETFAGALIHNATVSVDGLPLGAATDSLGAFGLRLPPGSHRLEVLYIGFEPTVVPVEVRRGRAVEVRVRLGAYVPGVDMCVSSSDW